MLDAHALGGGFSDPVFQSQAVFRALMDAMARPGTVHGAAGETLLPPAPLSVAAAAVALTLCDHDSAVWLDPVLTQAPAVAEWLTFHTGATIVGDPPRAAFGIISNDAALPELAQFATGTDEYPDRSTTLILQVESLSGEHALTLSGPGILGLRQFAPHPLPADFISRWTANGALFPRGVDLIFCSPTEIAAVPRSTRITGQVRN